MFRPPTLRHCLRRNFSVKPNGKKSVLIEKGTVPDLKTFMQRTMPRTSLEADELHPHYLKSQFGNGAKGIFLNLFF